MNKAFWTVHYDLNVIKIIITRERMKKLVNIILEMKSEFEKKLT